MDLRQLAASTNNIEAATNSFQHAFPCNDLCPGMQVLGRKAGEGIKSTADEVADATEQGGARAAQASDSAAGTARDTGATAGARPGPPLRRTAAFDSPADQSRASSSQHLARMRLPRARSSALTLYQRRSRVRFTRRCDGV